MQELIESLATSVVNILVIFAVLRMFVYKPVYNYLSERSSRISKEVSDAHDMLAKASDAHRNLAGDISKAQKEAESEYQKIVESAKESAAAILSNAAKRAEGIVSLAKEEAEAIRIKKLSDSENEICDLSVTIASRILEREISLEDNRRLVEKYLSEVKGDAQNAS
jgi:F-type H+-transporting ATPase subunit b